MHCWILLLCDVFSWSCGTTSSKAEFRISRELTCFTRLGVFVFLTTCKHFPNKPCWTILAFPVCVSNEIALFKEFACKLRHCTCTFRWEETSEHLPKILFAFKMLVLATKERYGIMKLVHFTRDWDECICSVLTWTNLWCHFCVLWHTLTVTWSSYFVVFPRTRLRSAHHDETFWCVSYTTEHFICKYTSETKTTTDFVLTQRNFRTKKTVTQLQMKQEIKAQSKLIVMNEWWWWKYQVPFHCVLTQYWSAASLCETLLMIC